MQKYSRLESPEIDVPLPGPDLESEPEPEPEPEPVPEPMPLPKKKNDMKKKIKSFIQGKTLEELKAMDYYDILMIDKSNFDSMEEEEKKDYLTKHYRKIVRFVHPDKYAGEDSTEKTQLINVVYSTLLDRRKRECYDGRNEEAQGGWEGASSATNYQRNRYGSTPEGEAYFNEQDEGISELYRKCEEDRRRRGRGGDEERCNLDSGCGIIGQTLTCFIDTISCGTVCGGGIVTLKHAKLLYYLRLLGETTTPTLCEFTQFLIANSHIVYCAMVGGLSCAALKFLFTPMLSPECANYFLGIERMCVAGTSRCRNIQDPDMNRSALKPKKNTKKKRKYKRKKQTTNKRIKKKRKSKKKR